MGVQTQVQARGAIAFEGIWQARRKGWAQAATELASRGYTLRFVPDTVHGVEFEKEGADTLYLFQPRGDNPSYIYQPSDRWFADIADETIVRGVRWKKAVVVEYVPSPSFDPEKGVARRNLRRWIPRPLRTKPFAFSFMEISEHVGLSANTVKTAVYIDGSLIPTVFLGNKRLMVCNEPDLMAWLDRRADRNTSSYVINVLESASPVRLIRLVRAGLESGELPIDAALDVAVRADPTINREQLEMGLSDGDLLLDTLQGLSTPALASMAQKYLASAKSLPRSNGRKTAEEDDSAAVDIVDTLDIEDVVDIDGDDESDDDDDGGDDGDDESDDESDDDE